MYNEYKRIIKSINVNKIQRNLVPQWYMLFLEENQAHVSLVIGKDRFFVHFVKCHETEKQIR